MSAHTQTSPQTDFIQRWVFFVPTAAPYLEQFSSSKHFPALLSVFTASHCSCTCCDTQQQQQISPSSGNHHDNNNNTNNPVASPRSSFASSSPFPSIPPSAPFNFHVSTLPLRCYSGRNACVKRRADAIQQTVCDAVYFDAHGHSAYLESSSHPSKGDVISSRSRHQTYSAATSISPNRAIPISPSQQTQYDMKSRKNSEADDMSIAPSVAGPSSFSSFSANLSIGSNIPFTFGPVDVSDPTPQQQQGIVFQRTKSVMAALPQRWSQALSPRSPCAPHFSSSNSPLLCLSPVNAEEDKLFGIMEPCEQKHVQQLEEKMQQIQVAMQSLQSASGSTTVNNSNSNESQSVVSSPYVSPYASPSVDPLLPSSNAIQAALQSEGDTYRAIRESQLRLKANSGGDYSPSLEYVHMPSNSIHAEQQYYTMQDGCWYKIFVQIPVQCQCKCGAAAVEEFARDEPLAGSAASSATPSPTAASAASAASVTSSQHKHLVRISVRFGVSIPTRDFAKEALNIFQANSLYQTICKAFPITSQYPSSPGMSTSPPQANSPPLACSPISDSNRPSASRAKLPPDFYPPSNWRLIRCPDDIQPDCSILLLKQLTMPTYKHLSNAGIESISQLANLTPAQLAALKGVPKLSHLQESASAVLRAIVAHQTRFATAHQSVPFVVLAQSKHDSVSLGNFANISSPTVLELSSRGAWMGHGQQASFPSIDLLLHSLMASSSARNPAPPANSSSHMQVNGARVTSSMLGSSANSSSAVRPNCHSPSLNNNGWSPRSGEETDRSVISPRSSSIASEQDEFHQQQLMQQGGNGGGGFMNPQPQLYNNNNQMSNQSVASKDPTAAIVLATKDMAMTDVTSQRPDQQQQQQQQAQSSQLPMLVQRVASPVSSNSVTATATSPHHQFQSPPARVVSPSMLAASRRSSFNSSSSTPTPSVMQFNQLHQNRGAAQSRRTEPPFHVLDQLKRQGCFHSSEPVSSAASINLNNWAEKVFREAWSSFLQFGNHYSAVVPVSAPVSGAGGGVGPGGNGSDQLMVDYFIKRSDFLAKGGFILNGGHEYILTANELALLWDLVLLPHNASNPNSPTNPPNHPQQTGVERGECVLYFSLYVRLYTWMYSTAPLEGDEAAAEPNSPLSPQSQNTIASPHSPYQLQSPRAPVSSQSQDDSVQSPPSASFPTRAPLLIDLRSLLSFLQTHITWLREYCTAFGLSLFSNRMEAERDLTTYAQWKRGPFVRIRFCEGRYDRWLQDQVEHEIGLPDFSISSTDNELSDVENIVLNSSPASRSPSSPTLASSPRRKFVYRELRDRRQPLHRQLIASLCKVNVDGSYIPNEFIHHALLVQDDRNHSRGMLSSNNGGGGGSNASVVASPINSNNRSVYLLCLDGHTVCNSFQYLNQEAELIGTLKERLVEDELIAKVNQVSFHLVGIQPHASPNDQPSELNAKRKFVQQYCRYHGGPFNPTIPQMDFNRMQQGQQLSPNHVQRQLQQQQQQQQPQQPQQMQNPPSHQQHSQSLYRPPSDVRNPQLHNSSNMLMTSASVPNLHLNRQQPQQQQQQQQQNPIALPSHMSYPNQQQHQQGNARGHNMRIPQAFAGQGSYPQNQFAANQVPMQQQAQSGFPFQQHAQQAAYAMNQQPHVPSLVLPPLAPLAALSLNNNQADPLSTRGNAPNYSEGVNPGSNGPYNSFVVPSVLSPHSAARHAQLLAAQQQQQQPQVSQHQYDHDASGEYYRSAAQSYRPGMHATSFNDQQQQQNEVELQSTVALLQQQLREQEELSRQLQEQQHWQQQQQLAQQHQQHPGQQQYYNNYSSAQEQQQQQQQQQHPVQHSQHYDANLLYNSNSSLSTTSPANAGVSYAAVPAVPVVAAVVSKSASTSKLPSVQPSAGRKARSNNNSGDANASGSASTTTSADVLARRLIQTTIEDHRNNTNNNGSRVGVAAAPAAAAATTTATTTTTSVKKRKAVASKRSSNPPQTTASAAGNNNATPSVVTPPSPSNRQLKPSRAAIEKQTKLAPIDTNLSPTAAGTTAVSAFRFNSSSSNMLLATNTNSPVSASSPAAAASASGSNDSFAAARSLIHNTAHRGHKMLQEQKANLRKKTLQPLSSTSGSPASLAPRDSGTGNGSTNAHHDLHPGVFTSKALDRHSGSGGGFLMLTPSSQGLHGNSPQSGFLSLDSPSSLGLGGGLGQSLSRSGLTPKAKRLQQRRPSHDTPKQHELLLQAGLDVGASPAGNMYQEAAERAGASAVRPLRSQTGMLDLSPAPSSLRNSGSSGIDAMFITKSSSISINSSQHGDSLGMEWNS